MTTKTVTLSRGRGGGGLLNQSQVQGCATGQGTLFHSFHLTLGY